MDRRPGRNQFAHMANRLHKEKHHMKRHHWLPGTIGGLLVALVAFAFITWHSLMPLPTNLEAAIRVDTAPAQQVLAADGTPLNLSFGGHYNLSARLPLSDMPLLLR